MSEYNRLLSCKTLVSDSKNVNLDLQIGNDTTAATLYPNKQKTRKRKVFAFRAAFVNTLYYSFNRKKFPIRGLNNPAL
jgi:hypothetical protein